MWRPCKNSTYYDREANRYYKATLTKPTAPFVCIVSSSIGFQSVKHVTTTQKISQFLQLLKYKSTDPTGLLVVYSLIPSKTCHILRPRLRILKGIHSVFCLTTGPNPPPKRCLHIVRCRASFFKWEYPLLSLRSSSSFLRLLPRLLATSIYPFIFPSITCFRRQFLRKMWPIQLAFLFLISCRT